MFKSIANGLTGAGRHWKLGALLWAWYLLISLVPALPGLAWLRAGLDFTPAAAEALRRFDFGLLGDLSNYDRSGVIGLLILTTMAAALVAMVSSAFVMGGVLEVLGGPDEPRTFMHRFARGGGHFFFRFVRLAATAGGCGLLATGIVAAIVVPVTAPLRDSQWEPGGYLAALLLVIAMAGTAALFLLALDYARIRVVSDDSRKMVRAYFGGLGFVVRHLVSAYGMALVIIAILAGVFMLYLAYETNSPVASTGALIAVLFVFQQVATMARVFLRVSLVGAERAFFTRKTPVAVAVQAPAAAAVDVAGAPTQPTEPTAMDEA